MVVELFGDVGLFSTVGAAIVALWKTLKARNLGQAVTAIGKLWNSNNKEVTKTEDLNKEAQMVVAANADAVLMTGALKKQITDGLADNRKTEILQIIYDNENDGIPGDSYKIEIPEKGVRYEIFAGKIRNIIALENLTNKSGNIGDPGSCEIFRVWGGKSTSGGYASAGDVPARQPEEITVTISDRKLFVSCKATEQGTVTLGVFVDRKLIDAKIGDFQANDLDTAKTNNISFSVYDFSLPKRSIQDAQETDEEFDLVVAWARGGKWYYLLGDNGADVPWEGQVSLKANCPAPVKTI